jgi:hypothetical protein
MEIHKSGLRRDIVPTDDNPKNQVCIGAHKNITSEQRQPTACLY